MHIRFGRTGAKTAPPGQNVLPIPSTTLETGGPKAGKDEKIEYSFLVHYLTGLKHFFALHLQLRCLH